VHPTRLADSLVAGLETLKAFGVEVVRALVGSLPAGQGIGVIVSPGGFSAEAKAAARERGVTLWSLSDIEKLAGMNPASPS